jgi:hypothetical protein
VKLDLRIPIGLMFGVVGIILAIYGLFSERAIYHRSLEININLWWGIVLFVFGAVMLLLAIRAGRKISSRD